MKSFLQDLRYGFRQLRNNRGFAITAIVTLSLGIGASGAIFALMDAALIKPLPYKAPTRLVNLYESIPLGPRFHLSYPDYRDWKRLNTVFSSLDVYENNAFSLTTPDGAQLADGARVSAGFFRTLGVAPVLGRDFQPDEDQPSVAPLVLLSYSAWQKRYGGRKDVLGQTVVLDGTPNTIIGVLPPEFHFAPAEPADFWSTMLAGNRECRYCHGLYGIARLKDDVSFSAAFADIAAIARQLEQQYPDTNHAQAAYMLPLTEVIVGDIRPVLLVVFSGAVLLLLIAGVNVTSLLLVRAEGRKREIAVRGALGASPARIMRQLVTEGLVLAMIGSFFGLVTALWASKLLIGLVPKDRMASMPFLHGAGLNSDVIIFVLAISFVAGLLVSLIPALRLPFSQGLEVLQEGGRTSAGTVWRKLGAKLVVVELATAVLLLVGAGLLLKSLQRLLQVDTGMEPQQLVTLQTAAPPFIYSKHEKAIALERDLMDRVGVLPGVKSVSITNKLPLGDADFTTQFVVVGRPDNRETNEVTYRRVSANYFSTLQARLLGGRYFAESDDSSKPLVTIINAAFAKRYFPDENPVGKQINYRGAPATSAMEIVGVVDEIKEGQLDFAPRPAFYVPFNQQSFPFFSVVVRATQDSRSLLPAISNVIHGIDPSIASFDGETMIERLHDSPAAYLHRSSAWLAGGFAGLALLLGVIGLYGVIAYSVSQRTREIGIRMALGAQQNSVMQLILGEAGTLAMAGIAAGVACSLVATILMRKLLFGVRPWDLPTFAVVAVALAFCALLASYIPARRAAKLDPMVALRYE
ncbi:MAG: ABC transporter permease [Acidobacteria bacterium]|nr:MAG: ABC transporter permease [Acidobacteriota bacterium]